ncbi:MAG: HAD-IA family hydrolase [Candidatus Bathyarchaeota archaeon]|nr:MAG: HAD-IA family hydrolase [Candidatus Bathyarchaeota archaeon]
MLEGIKLVIYDLDGVLVDSSGAICIAFNRVLEEVGVEALPEEDIRRMIGEPLNAMFRKVIPEESVGLVNGYFERYREIFSGISTMHTRVLDGVEETLAYFMEKGLKQSLATNKTTGEAVRILEHVGLRWYLDLLLGFTDVENPKPSPDIIRLTLDWLGVEAMNAVLVDDSPTGLEAGEKAGVHTVAVTTGYLRRGQLAYSDPDYVIDDLLELMGIIVC